MSQEIPPRSALLDVTNHANKRGFSLISTSADDDVACFQLAKKECLRPDNFNNKENPVHPPTPTPGVEGSVELKGKPENDSPVTEQQEHNKDINIDNIMDSNRDEYIESQESRCDLEGGDLKSMDLLKTCRCSFCIKAGNLLADLHYQDIKGRIAVINKSQKEATVLVHRNTRDARSPQISNLDSDLTGRWKSLFRHMEDMFVREAAQLETSLSALNEMRDNCNTRSTKN